jgi:predicted RNA-binding protein with PIN domain
MYYLLDGYNLLFSSFFNEHLAINPKSFSKRSAEPSLESQRQQIIFFLQKQCAARKLSGLLIFDGKTYCGDSGRSYESPLEVIYTQAGQSADEYIIDWLTFSKKQRQATVVTNDRILAVNIGSYGIKVMDNTSFMQWLMKEKKSDELAKPTIIETKRELDRLLKIFEEQQHHPMQNYLK